LLSFDPSLGSALAQPWLSLGSALAQSALSQPCLSLVSALSQPWLSLGSALAQPWLSLGSALAQPWLLHKVSRAFDLGHIDFIKTSHISFCLVFVLALPYLCLDSALSRYQPYLCLVSVLSLSVLARVAAHNIVSAFLFLETTMAPVGEDMDDGLYFTCQENKNMLTQIIAIYSNGFGLPAFPTFPRSPLLLPLAAFPLAHSLLFRSPLLASARPARLCFSPLASVSARLSALSHSPLLFRYLLFDACFLTHLCPLALSQEQLRSRPGRAMKLIAFGSRAWRGIHGASQSLLLGRVMAMSLPPRVGRAQVSTNTPGMCFPAATVFCCCCSCFVYYHMSHSSLFFFSAPATTVFCVRSHSNRERDVAAPLLQLCLR
jgi:hypothetical protein